MPNKAERAANRAKWVAALRSGKYPQTKRCLEDFSGFCCLGVACKLAAEEGIVRRQVDGHTVHYVWDSPESDHPRVSTAFLPDPVLKWLGLAVDDGELKGGNSLAALNDNGCSFDHIADVIESGKVKLKGGR